ncbi:MAG: hypothetical protein RL748_330 [Pseudomonadota bacterium]
MRLTPFLFSLLMLHGGLSHAAAPVKPADAKPSPRAASKNARLAAAEGNTRKHVSNGFSFLIEARPGWVETVQPDNESDAKIAASKAALQISLNDEQIKVEGKQHQHFVHVMQKINSSAGLGPGSQIQMGFDPAYQELVLHKIELLRDGQRINKLDPKRVQLLQRETQLEARLYDGRVTASLVLDDVRTGDVVDYAYTVRGSNPVFNGKFSHIDSAASNLGPIGYYSLRVMAPENRPLQFRAPTAMQVQTQTRAGQNEWQFVQYAIAQPAYEEGTPASSSIANLIQLSEFTSWNEVASWGAQLFGGVSPVTEPISRQAASWQSSASTPEQKLQLALDLVQKEVRYFGTEIGVNSHLPALPHKVLEQRFGDCKDKTTLLIALLKAQQIEARPALVSTYFKANTANLLPSPLAFNHVIAEVQIGGKKYYLDGTRSHQTGPFAQRQTSDFGKVLITDPQSRELTAVPDVAKELHQTVEDHFKLDNMSSDPVLISTITYYGESAEYMRQTISRTPLAEVQTQFNHFYLEAYPKIVPAKPLRVEEVADKNALRLIFEFTMKQFWHIGKLDQAHSDLEFWSLKQRLRHPQDASRNTPWEIGLPGSYQHTIIADFSEELLDAQEEQKTTEGQANFSLHLSTQASTKRATWNAQLRYLSHSVKPGQWRSFIDKVKQVRTRLDHNLVAHVLDKKQIARLEKEIGDLDRGSRNPKKVFQAYARAALSYCNTMLESGRLSPDLRTKVLTYRATTQESLGQYDAGFKDIEAAMATAGAEDSHLLTQAAKLAIARQQDAQAKQWLNQSLQLAPHDPFTLYVNLTLDYLSGNFLQVKAAADKQLAQNNQGDQHLALWRFLAARRSGGDGKADLQAMLSGQEAKSWPQQMMQLYLGQRELKPIVRELDEQSNALEALTLVYFFTAEKMQLDGDLAGAREYWQKVLDSGLAQRLEYMIAKRRLAAQGS